MSLGNSSPSSALAVRQQGPTIGVARMRALYRLGDVEQRLDKLPAHEHEALRADRKSTRLNSSHLEQSRMPSSA